MQAVVSSAVTELGVDDQGNLYARFNSGKVYRYDGAAHFLPTLLDPSVSIGKMLNASVKPQHPASEVQL